MKSGNLNFVEPSGPLQACNGTALPFYVTQITVTIAPLLHRTTINPQYNPEEPSFVHIGTILKFPSREKSGSCIRNHSQTAISTSAFCWIGDIQWPGQPGWLAQKCLAFAVWRRISVPRDRVSRQINLSESLKQYFGIPFLDTTSRQ